MREYTRKNRSESRTLDNGSKTARQASVSELLQAQKERNNHLVIKESTSNSIQLELMSIEEFQENTKKWFSKRRRIGKIDTALTAYNQCPENDRKEKSRLLKELKREIRYYDGKRDISCLESRLKDEELTLYNYSQFTSTNYINENVELGQSGHFKIDYNPIAKELKVKIPVRFERATESEKSQDMQSEDKTYCLEHMNETWSHRFSINTCLENNNENKWQDLNPVLVSVSVFEDEDPFFLIYYHVKEGPEDKLGAMVDKGKVRLTDKAFNETRYASAVIPENNQENGQEDTLRVYNVLGHEFGHMVGLYDEYIITPTGSYKMIRRVFGKKYADENVPECDINKSEDKEQSIMYCGIELKKHHYITFLQAMTQAIQDKEEGWYGPNYLEEWTIVE